MDPFTISTACIGLASGITALSTQIFNFASNVRDARKDLDAVSRELSSLQMCLSTLQNDAVTINYPPRIKENIYEILKNCQSKVTDMTTLLLRVKSSTVGRSLQWSVVYRDQVNSMRIGIEAYKSSLEIALELGSTLLITAVQETANATQTDVTLIRRDVARISRLMNDTRKLRSHFHHLEEQGINISIPLQRFLDETESYAESVRDTDHVYDVEDDWWEAESSTTERPHAIQNSATGNSARAGGSTRRRPIPSGLRADPHDGAWEVPDYVSGEFAAYVYVVPLQHRKIAESLAHRSALDERSKRLLDEK